MTESGPAMEKSSPSPWGRGAGGGVRRHAFKFGAFANALPSVEATPPPNPLPQGAGEDCA
jgi:hypothetical protein